MYVEGRRGKHKSFSSVNRYTTRNIAIYTDINVQIYIYIYIYTHTDRNNIENNEKKSSLRDWNLGLLKPNKKSLSGTFDEETRTRLDVRCCNRNFNYDRQLR